MHYEKGCNGHSIQQQHLAISQLFTKSSEKGKIACITSTGEFLKSQDRVWLVILCRLTVP